MRRGGLTVAACLALAVTVTCAGPGLADDAPATTTVQQAAPDHPRPRPPKPRPPAPKPPAPKPRFHGSVSAITPRLAERMQASWREGCPVPLEQLRYVRVTHVDFHGHAKAGELVVHEDVADGIVEIFSELYAAGFPIRQMRLVDDFGADDDASMAADNTSAFNCRAVTGTTDRFSEHSYGWAIDINPVENPYVRDTLVLPPTGAPYVDRPDLPGVIHADDVVVRAFEKQGWHWGGYWTRPIDYQHFSTTNG